MGGGTWSILLIAGILKSKRKYKNEKPKPKIEFVTVRKCKSEKPDSRIAFPKIKKVKK